MRAAHTLAFFAVAFVVPFAARAADPAASDPAADLGSPVAAEILDTQRGGDDTTTNIAHITGEVSDNSATNVATGANTIREGSFANSSGISTVVQNTGANVLIQNATIVNVQFVDP